VKSIEQLKFRYSAENPLAPPDRRYRLVKACFKRGVQPPVGDRFTWELFNYLREQEAAYEPSAEVRIQRTWWELVTALSLYRGESQTFRPLIEAFLLADEEPRSIAARLGVPENAILWFRVIFFDIEAVRNAPLRVLHDIIGISPDAGARLQPNQVLKLVGYCLKSKALDQLLCGDGVPGATVKTDLTTWIAERLRTDVSIKQLVATRTLDGTDPKHAAMLVRLGLQADNKPRETDDEVRGHFMQWIDGVLSGLPFSCGQDAEDLFAGTVIGRFDDSRVELNADDLERASLGDDLADLEHLLTFPIPPPRKRGPRFPGADGEGLK